MSPIRAQLLSFIRSYHKKQFLGALLLVLLESIILFYGVNYTEHFLWLSASGRKGLFFFWWILLLTLFIWQLGKPLLQWLGLRNGLSQTDAALIIGKYFPEVQDRLLNLLQLEDMSRQQDWPLLEKSIQQKTQDLNKFSFLQALEWQQFRKQAIRFGSIILVMTLWGVYDAQNISAASQRWFNFDKEFVQKAPFDFVRLDTHQFVAEGGSAEIKLKFEGKALPTGAEIQINDGVVIPMNKGNNQVFTFNLKSLNQSTKFKFLSGKFSSKEFNLHVIKLPKWKGISIKAHYPAYTGWKDAEIDNFEQFQVPEGTQLQIRLQTENTKTIHWRQNNLKQLFSIRDPKKQTDIRTMILEDAHFKGTLEKPNSSDSIGFFVSCIKDEFPELFVESKTSDLNPFQHFFSILANDDYGISDAWVEIRNSEKEEFQKVNTFSNPGISKVFGADWAYQLNQEQQLEIRFAVRDNDALRRGKVRYSVPQKIKAPTKTELEKITQQQKIELEKSLGSVQKQAQNLRKESEKLQESLKSSQSMSFDTKEKIEDWAKKQEERLKQAEKIQEKLKQQEQNLKSQDPELKDRREEISEKIKEMKNPELEKLLQELNELLQKNAPQEQVEKKMRDINQQVKNQEQQLENIMEQLKELRLEESVKNQIDQMKNWSEKMKEIAKKTETLNKKDDAQRAELEKQINEQKKELQDLKEKAADIQKQNKELESPMNLKTGEKSMDKAQESLDKAQQELQKKQDEKSAEDQKKSAEEMDKAQKEMEESMEQSQKERLSEDMATLRSLLEGLIEVSHRQESIFTELKGLKSDNPRVLVLNRNQVLVKEMALNLEDSLRALAKRQPMVSERVTKELNKINDYLESSLSDLKNRDVRRAAANQQFVMTGFNDLAVMLMESLKNVQQKMSQQNQKSQSKSGQSCSNPNKSGNSGKTKMGKGSKLSEAQKQLGEQLQKMQQGQQQGQQGQKGDKTGTSGDPKSGNGKDSKNGQQGNKSGGKEQGRSLEQDLVEMALLQEQLRRQIQELRKEALKNGNTGDAANLHKLEQLMEEQEKNLVNKTLDERSVQRQKEIMTRLLEHEKAERKQGQEDNRESQQSKPKELLVPDEIRLETQKRIKQKEQLQRIPPALNPYYEEKIKQLPRQR